MTITYPEARKAYGNTHIGVLQTLADIQSPSVAALTGAGGETISCFVYGGRLGTAVETNRGPAPRRACDDSEREIDGATKYTMEPLQILYDPQGDPEDTNNAARSALAEGSTVYLIERLGLSAKNVAWAVGQKVVVHHVRLGKHSRTTTGDGEFDEFSITITASYLSDPVETALVA